MGWLVKDDINKPAAANELSNKNKPNDEVNITPQSSDVPTVKASGINIIMATIRIIKKITPINLPKTICVEDSGDDNNSVRVLFIRSSANKRMVIIGITASMIIPAHKYSGESTIEVTPGGFCMVAVAG